MDRGVFDLILEGAPRGDRAASDGVASLLWWVRIPHVEQFVPDHGGLHYEPHLTLGRAALDDLLELAAEPTTPVSFSSPALGAYRLGDHGTARRRLARWER